MTISLPALLCFDGSEDARRAIEDAARLLAPRPAVVLTVWEAARDLTPLDPVGDTVGRLSGIYAELDAAGLQAAREVADRGAQLARDAGFEPRTRVECGPVWQSIVAIGADEDAAVIVVGARGLSRAAAVLGSVSARVGRHAGRPVLVVPPPDDQPRGPRSLSSTPRTQ
jgi:nucleotide-binding universal stress UspA family protein